MTRDAFIGHLAPILEERRDAVIGRWSKQVAAALGGRTSHDEVAREVRDLYDGLLRGLAAGGGSDIADEPYGELRATLSELSRSRARQGFSPRETAVSVFTLKDAVVAETSDAPGAEVRDFFTLSALVDSMGVYTFEMYVHVREQVITEQSHELLELSTPVVKLWQGVVGVPLIGTLDSARAQVVMEKLLQTLVDTGSRFAIIDITGVPAVDTQVAQHLLKTVVAARLMGAECVISGIRPQIAQTVVALGIEFEDIMTKASLADALLHAIRRGGFDVVRGAAKRA